MTNNIPKPRSEIDVEVILAQCDIIDAATKTIRETIFADPNPPDPQPPVVVGPGDDLQAALDAGGAIEMDVDACFEQAGGFLIRTPGTSLTGQGGNTVTATNGHAFDVPIDVDDLVFERLRFVGTLPEAFQLGVNGTSQDTVEKAPRGIVFRDVTSTGHRGKRAFDVNAADVQFLNCEVRDCFDPGGNWDSQAICVLNAPGPVLIEGGYYEAASENIMVGGDTMKIPDCRPTGITIRNVTLSKPLAWKTAGTPAVKNLLELKDGNDVLIENCELTNCWRSGQDGYAFVFTPSKGGSNRNVVVKNCRVSNVGGIVNIIGTDKSGINATRSQITFLGGDYRTNLLEMGGRGIFALVGEGATLAGPQGCEWLIVDGCTIHVDGTALIDIYDKTPGSIDLLKIVGSTWNYPKYGIRIGGYSHGEDFYGVCKQIIIEGNTITGAASSFKSRYPNNTYVSAFRFGTTAERHRDGWLRGDELAYPSKHDDA